MKKRIVIWAMLFAALFLTFGCKGTKTSKENMLEDADTYASYDCSFITKLADYSEIHLTKDLTVSDEQILLTYDVLLEEIAGENDFDAQPPVLCDSYQQLLALRDQGKAAENWDYIRFDYSGKLDGELMEGGTDTNVFTLLGAQYFIPGFEESIVGHKAGETFDIQVTFPSSYPQNHDLENKEVIFTITLHEILPGLSDASIRIINSFQEAKYLAANEDGTFTPDYQNEADFRKYVITESRKQAQEAFDQNLDNAILEKLYAECEYGTLPADQIEAFQASVDQTAEAYGVTRQVYLYYSYGISTDEQFEELTKQQVCVRGILSAIIQKEGMKISEEDFNQEVAKIVAEYGYESPEELIAEAGTDNILNSILTDRLFTLLENNAVIETLE